MPSWREAHRKHTMEAIQCAVVSAWRTSISHPRQTPGQVHPFDRQRCPSNVRHRWCVLTLPPPGISSPVHLRGWSTRATRLTGKPTRTSSIKAGHGLRSGVYPQWTECLRFTSGMKNSLKTVEENAGKSHQTISLGPLPTSTHPQDAAAETQVFETCGFQK